MLIIRTTLVFLVLFFVTSSIHSQNAGIITYSTTTKLEIKLPAGMKLSGMMPTEHTTLTDVTFNESASLERVSDEAESEDKEITSDDGRIKMVLMDSGIDEKTYHDYKQGIRIERVDLMGKAFIIKDSIRQVKWKIIPEKIKYLGYECMKAMTTSEEGQPVIAWFAPSIKTQAGPGNYGQLPGAILILSVGKDTKQIKATKVVLKDVGPIDAPDDGKVVTQKEFDLIQKEKMEEINNSMRKGGTRIEIRG